jgi:hypothetical protein
MQIHPGWRVKRLAVTVTLLFALTACGQKKLSESDLGDAMIGPESTIEITPGSNYTVKIMRPNPDGPLSPLNAPVAWSLESPVIGISIDRKSGLISVGNGVPNGATAIVVASIESGRRVLKARLHVFTREVNPLVGRWHVESLVACSDGREMKPDATLKAPLVREHLHIQADGGFWIGLEMNIAAHTLMNGAYEYDLKAGTIRLTPKWPPRKPAVLWKFNVSEEGRKLAVRTPVPEDPAGQVCGYVYRQQ